MRYNPKHLKPSKQKGYLQHKLLKDWVLLVFKYQKACEEPGVKNWMLFLLKLFQTVFWILVKSILVNLLGENIDQFLENWMGFFRARGK